MFLIITLGVIAFLLALGITPLVRNLAARHGLVDRPDGGRKLHARPIPRLGGIAITLSYLGTFAVALFLPFTFGATLRHALPEGFNLCIAAAVVFATGLIDDLRGLRVHQKLFGQFVAATLAFWAGVEVHLFGASFHEPWIAWLVTVLWLVACSNAFNLIDGMDGFAAGVGLFATLTILLAALTQQNLTLVVVTVPLAGCLLGFLRYNFNPASIFLGDCGSLLIGFLLGCYGALWSNKSATLLGMTAPLMAMSIPLLDAGLSIARRFLRRQSIFKGDRGHIHHRLLDRGFTTRQAVLIMYGACGLAATFSLAQNALQNQFGGLIVVLFCFAAWVGLQHLGYQEFSVASRMLTTGNFRRIIDAETRLHKFEESLTRATDLSACWEELCVCSREFGFHGVRLSMQGIIFDDFARARSGGTFWQLRIPLPENQYVNFDSDFNQESPLILSTFAKVVERALISRMSNEAGSRSAALAATAGSSPGAFGVR